MRVKFAKSVKVRISTLAFASKTQNKNKSSKMDIFGDDIDSYMENNGLNENIRPESDVEEVEGNVEPNENEDENAEKDENGEPIKVEPKKRFVRKPQVT